jgi:DNA-directed RNA polymerase subunit E'/Rpb7
MEAIFVRSLLRDATLLKPQFIGSNFREVLQQQIRDKVEGICSRHGYVLPNSVMVHRISPGRMEAVSLNGDVRFDVQYYAHVCNPPVGAVLPARVANTNRFGVLAHCGILQRDGEFLPVVEAIATKQPISGKSEPSEVDIDALSVGDDIRIEVLGKKFELNDDRISVIARVVGKVANQSDKDMRAKATAASAAVLMPPLRFAHDAYDSNANSDDDAGSGDVHAVEVSDHDDDDSGPDQDNTDNDDIDHGDVDNVENDNDDDDDAVSEIVGAGEATEDASDDASEALSDVGDVNGDDFFEAESVADSGDEEDLP